MRRFPYVPNRPAQLDQDCYEAFNIQVQGLARRFQATSGKHLVIGVSGGLDSTHALIVAARACDDLKLPRSTLLGLTIPGAILGRAQLVRARSGDPIIARELGVIEQAAMDGAATAGRPRGAPHSGRPLPSGPAAWIPN